MGKVIDFPLKEVAKGYIEIEHTEDFLILAKSLSEFLKGLPISNDYKDQLFKLILGLLQQGETDSFLQGFDMGLVFAAYHQE